MGFAESLPSYTQNFYVFEILVGITSLAYGGSFWNKSLIGVFAFIVLGAFLLIDGVFRWNNQQRGKEQLMQLELKNKDATLDFDIKQLKGTNDIYYAPETFDDKGQPKRWSITRTIDLEIELMIYNSCEVENVVRNIEVSIKQNNEIHKMEQVHFTEISINPRKYLSFNFECSATNFHGKENDLIAIEITTMDNKKVKKEKNIKKYHKGEELRESLGEI